VDAFGKALPLRNGGDSSDFFILAMVHQGLGHTEEARRWYDKAVQWMEKNQPRNPELLRFRAEAARLLAVKEKPGHRREETRAQKQ
jgi:hypothetical protein